MTAHTLRIGVVGLGAHARRGHIDHLDALPDAEIVAVCDPSAQARQRYAGAGTRYATFDELLADPAVDALVIASPDRFHADALARGVAAGKHVLVEKPVADRRGDLPAVLIALKEAEAAGLTVTSCHPRRFDPPFIWLKDRLPTFTRHLGTVLDVRFDFFYHRPSKTGLHHGLLIDHVNHEIDLIHFLFGPSPFTAYRLFDDEVRYGAAGGREDGICFTFFGSRHLERQTYAEVLRVRHERGEVEIDTETGIATIHDLDADTMTTEICGRTDYDERFRAVNADFVRAALDSTPPYLTAADLLVNTEIGIALTEDGRHDSGRR